MNFCKNTLLLNYTIKVVIFDSLYSNAIVMLDGKEINETAKRFLMNWKANRDARRQQRKQLHFLEGGTASDFISSSSNALSSIPLLPPITDGGYVINPGMNPLIYDGNAPGGPHSVALPRGTKPLAAIMQARAPNSTLLNRKPADDMSQSRYEHQTFCKILHVMQWKFVK